MEESLQKQEKLESYTFSFKLSLGSVKAARIKRYKKALY